jgi:hypothetical protein
MATKGALTLKGDRQIFGAQHECQETQWLSSETKTSLLEEDS